MVAYCQNPNFCPEGNCEGCKNGQIWCQDPRCAPYCSDCQVPIQYDNFVTSVTFSIIFLILLLAFIIFVFFGPKIIN
jgi:hypothetical protein